VDKKIIHGWLAEPAFTNGLALKVVLLKIVLISSENLDL
jgi:hypothetical protein